MKKYIGLILLSGISLYSADVVLNETPQSGSIEVSLKEGWNLVSSIGYDSYYVGELFGSSKISKVYAYDTSIQNWRVFIPGDGSSDLDMIEPSQGIWVKVNDVNGFSMKYNLQVGATVEAETTTNNTSNTPTTTETTTSNSSTNSSSEYVDTWSTSLKGKSYQYYKSGASDVDYNNNGYSSDTSNFIITFCSDGQIIYQDKSYLSISIGDMNTNSDGSANSDTGTWKVAQANQTQAEVSVQWSSGSTESYMLEIYNNAFYINTYPYDSIANELCY